MNISKNISSIREAKGIKQYQVAEILGIEPPNYSRLEKRGDKLTIEQLEKISVALGVSVKELLFGEKEEAKEDTAVLKTRIAELEGIIKDKEQINKYLSDKQAVCEEYLKEMLDRMFEDIAIDKQHFGVIIYLKNGKEERIDVKEINKKDKPWKEIEEILANEIRVEFTEHEISQTMELLFTDKQYREVSNLIMWTGTVNEPKYVNAFKKYGIRSNVLLSQIDRLSNSSINPLGVKGYHSKVGIIFE